MEILIHRCGSINCYSCCGNNLAVRVKTHMYIHCDLAIPLLAILEFSERISGTIHKKTHIRIAIDELVVIEKYLKQAKCPLIDLINNRWYI